MNLTDFISNFADLFDETDPESINAETRFHDLEEWDSLAALGLIALAKTNYGKTITGQDIKEAETVQDLFDILSAE